MINGSELNRYYLANPVIAVLLGRIIVYSLKRCYGFVGQALRGGIFQEILEIGTLSLPDIIAGQKKDTGKLYLSPYRKTLILSI